MMASDNTARALWAYYCGSQILPTFQGAGFLGPPQKFRLEELKFGHDVFILFSCLSAKIFHTFRSLLICIKTENKDFASFASS